MLLLLEVGVVVVTAPFVATTAVLKVQIGNNLAIVSDYCLLDIDMNLRKWWGWVEM